MRPVVFGLFLFLSALSFGQSADEQVAAQFYENGEYDKAAAVYKQLYRSSQSGYIYENYLNCLVALNDKDEALRLVKKQKRKYPHRINYAVDEGYIYHKFGEEDKAKTEHAILIRRSISERRNVHPLAQSFMRRNLYERATETYEMAVEQYGVASYGVNLLNLYHRTNQPKKVIDLSLKLIENSPNRLSDVLAQLGPFMEKEENALYLQKQTLLKVQQHPDKTVYEQLLLEVYLQQKKFNRAIRQAISLDKRNNLGGNESMKVSETCVQNRAYDAAITGYKYVISLGPQSMYALPAEHGLINAYYLKTTAAFVPAQDDVQQLIVHIEAFIEKHGSSYQTAPSTYLLAQLYLFHTPDTDQGIELLEGLTRTPRVSAHFMGKTKLLLGDAYLMRNNIWDAKLMYGQVDKDFKEDPLGQEAKYKNAKLSYYIGEFNWARTQLDILRTATSQFISNNAMELALLIQDNTGLDSTDDAMMEYAQAEFLLVQNKPEKCLEILNLLPFKYPNHGLTDEIYFLKAKVFEKQGKYQEANDFYKSVYTLHSADILADNALFRSAIIQLKVLKNPAAAQELFETILLEHSSSLFAVEARKYYFALKAGKSPEALFFEGEL